MTFEPLTGDTGQRAVPVVEQFKAADNETFRVTVWRNPATGEWKWTLHHPNGRPSTSLRSHATSAECAGVATNLFPSALVTVETEKDG